MLSYLIFLISGFFVSLEILPIASIYALLSLSLGYDIIYKLVNISKRRQSLQDTYNYYHNLNLEKNYELISLQNNNETKIIEEETILPIRKTEKVLVYYHKFYNYLVKLYLKNYLEFKNYLTKLNFNNEQIKIIENSINTTFFKNSNKPHTLALTKHQER